MNEYAESLLKLPGTEEEKEWLELRLEMLSVKEGIVLAAAVERSPPNTMMDAVNHLLTLEQYDVVPAGSYEQLGAFYLWNQCVPQEQRAFFDQSALGQWYEDEHPGLFVGNCYVAYPERDGPAPYDGQRLPTDGEWRAESWRCPGPRPRRGRATGAGSTPECPGTAGRCGG